MSRFIASRFAGFAEYVPGEQPKYQRYIKLNTNESPYPPPPGVQRALGLDAASTLNLYPDIDCAALTEALANRYGVRPANVIVANGSDDILNFAFIAFCGANEPAVFPGISYGFYPVYANLHGVPYRELPLRDDLTIDPRDYWNCGATVFIANPNAPTGLALSLFDIEGIARMNPDNVVVIDEAYVDFGADSAIALTKKYENLLIVQTFSKSRSMAGARLGYAIGNEALIADLRKIKFSTNPYNVNSLTQLAALASLADDGYNMANCRRVVQAREYTRERLIQMGFEVTASQANFLFACHPAIGGAEYTAALRAKGVLIRHFAKPEIDRFVRITIGTRGQMDVLLAATAEILQGVKQ